MTLLANDIIETVTIRPAGAETTVDLHKRRDGLVEFHDPRSGGKRVVCEAPEMRRLYEVLREIAGLRD
jgi:hypothetical protein